MAKYTCSECDKILLRSEADMRANQGKTYCESTNKEATLTRIPSRKADVPTKVQG